MAVVHNLFGAQNFAQQIVSDEERRHEQLRNYLRQAAELAHSLGERGERLAWMIDDTLEILDQPDEAPYEEEYVAVRTE